MTVFVKEPEKGRPRGWPKEYGVEAKRGKLLEGWKYAKLEVGKIEGVELVSGYP